MATHHRSRTHPEIFSEKQEPLFPLQLTASPSMGIQATRQAWRKEKHDPNGQLTLPQREQLYPHCPQARRPAPADYWNTRVTRDTGDQLEALFPDWQVPGTQ